MPTHQTDFRVRSHGSIWTFEPLTQAARHFAETDLDVQGWQWLGSAFGVDRRLADDLAAELEAEGFVVEP